MGTVRSARSLIASNGSRSSSFRRKCSMTFARCSSFLRRGVTFGCGIALDTWLSMFSNVMLRTWLVFFFVPSLCVSPGTSGVIVRKPL